MLQRRFTVIVLPEGRATARRVRIPYLVAIPGALALVGLFYAMGVLIYQSEMIKRQHREVVSVVHENAELKRQNSLLSEEAVKLAQHVEHIAARTEEFGTVLGFDSGLLSMGLGGPEGLRRDAVSDFTGRLRKDDLDSLRQEAEGVARSLSEVETTFRERSELLASIPSIPPVQGEVTSKFGYRFDPFTGVRAFHPALDINNDRGAPVVSTADGVITEAGYLAGYGLCVNVLHGYGFSTRYAHLQGIKVKVGQNVKKGEIIGVVGSTGRSTGYHLHYEVRIKDEPVDPTPYMVELTQQANLAARLEESLLEGVKEGVKIAKGNGE